MAELRIALNTLPAEGQTFIVEDPTVWEGPMAECNVTCRVVRPLVGEITLLPQEDGCLVRGHLGGEVVVPCNRCAEDAHLTIDSRFDTFEPFPKETEASVPGSDKDFDNEADAEVLSLVDGAVVINLAGLLWEEFVLALPVKPLCCPDCKGLCPVCGQNRNEASCACVQEGGDPRLAVLQGLKITKN